MIFFNLNLIFLLSCKIANMSVTRFPKIKYKLSNNWKYKQNN